MNSKGFALVETIVVVVVLTVSLLLLYTSYGKILQTEKTRVYYDDMACIYKTWNIKKHLDDDMSDLLSSNKDVLNKGNFFINIHDVNYIGDVIYKKFNDDLKYGITNNLIIANGDRLKDVANKLSSSYDFSQYIKSIYSDSNASANVYILIGEYNLGNNRKCYGWVRIV